MLESSRALWSSVVRRDPAADGLFIYAVRTTGVFCRPSCASRRPRAENVEYFPTPAMAVDAGYRSCKKCRPDRDGGADGRLNALQRACAAIARTPEPSWPMARIARVAGLSVPALARAFRRTLGLSPVDYVAACRRGVFLDHLKRGTGIADAIYLSGYGSPSRVYGRGRGGMTPASYRRGGVGVSIDWTTVSSPIGRVLVAATPKGACFVAVGADDAELESAVRAEFPRADLVRRSSSLVRPLAAAAKGVASARPVAWTMPADIIGTAFQWRVWRALTHLPRGRTMTYTELAQAIGHPKAVRAVARACATNPLALVVPCHRVVGSDGALRGYRWGIACKEGLIEREKESVL